MGQSIVLGGSRPPVCKDWRVHDPIPELSSLATALTDLSRRVSSLAEEANDAGKEALAIDLFEIERGLKGAQRRLTKLVSTRT